MRIKYTKETISFQLTTSRRGRLISLDSDVISMAFQLTTSRRGRHAFTMNCHITMKFQLTTSRRGRLCPSSKFTLFTMFQLTTSRRGRQVIELFNHVLKNVSTHDLTKRSTAIFTQKVFLSKSLFVLIAYNIFILH